MGKQVPQSASLEKAARNPELGFQLRGLRCAIRQVHTLLDRSAGIDFYEQARYKELRCYRTYFPLPLFKTPCIGLWDFRWWVVQSVTELDT